MNAEIIAIGTEILFGEIVDTNSAYMAAELAKLGIEVHWVSKVGDHPDRLYETIDRASRRADVTITSGGLGPTSDDLTRETVARVMGEEMEVQDDLLEQLKAIFAGRGGEMPATNIKQATLIPSAEVIPNPMGTAPGWWVDKGGHVIVCTPGPPRELERMWTYEIAPRLRQLNPDVAIVTRTIKTFGISEGGLDEMLTPLFQSENPTLGIYSKQDGIHLRAIATAGTESEAARLIEPMEAEIRSIVGDAAVWGVDDETPESQVAAFLAERGETLAVMENFTGGLLASTLAEMPESRGFLRGGMVLFGDEQLEDHGVDADLVAEHGAASGPVAEAMARAAQRAFGADYGIGVTGTVTRPTPTSGPLGTSHVGYALRGGAASTAGRYPTNLRRIRARAVTHALLEFLRHAGQDDGPSRPRRRLFGR